MDLFKLSARLQLDKTEYEQGLDDAESGAYRAGQHIGTGLKAVGAMAAAGIAATTTAIGGLVKSSVNAYAEYEQLAGGVETLFSNARVSAEDFAKAQGVSLQQAEAFLSHYGNITDTVMENAANAYKTSGLSANEYMETVTSFSASLISSLGENSYQAAHYAEVAVVDMADNANKMGTSMEAIKTAYAGFAKQNYTMLDNLKLGWKAIA